MKRIIPAVICLTLFGVTAACGDDALPPTPPPSGGTVAPGGATVPGSTPTQGGVTTPGGTPSTPEPAQCDSPAQSIFVGQAVEASLQFTSEANAAFYCVGVGPGLTQLIIEVTAMTGELDLYVGTGSLQASMASSPWSSANPGTQDERVTIDSPAQGMYYIEVYSPGAGDRAFVLRTEGI